MKLWSRTPMIFCWCSCSVPTKRSCFGFSPESKKIPAIPASIPTSNASATLLGAPPATGARTAVEASTVRGRQMPFFDRNVKKRTPLPALLVLQAKADARPGRARAKRQTHFGHSMHFYVYHTSPFFLPSHHKESPGDESVFPIACFFLYQKNMLHQKAT